jgi:beta-lactamase class C
MMPYRANYKSIFAACSILLATAGLSNALSQNSLPISTGSTAKADLPAFAAVKPVRDLRIDANEMEQLAERFVQQKKIPGMAMALVQNGQILSARGYGITSTSYPEAIRADTVFRLASLSKAFASTLTGILVEEKALEWETPIAKQLPAFKLKDYQGSQQLTVSDVLSQQVGLAGHALETGLGDGEPYPLLANKLSSAPMACSPGDCYGYQNVAYSLIGDMVFAVTGDFYSHQVEKKLFIPLGMKHATYGRDALIANKNWAKPHVFNGKSWNAIIPNENYYRVPPAAGVNASIQDMALWLNAQLGHRTDVLSATLLSKIQSPQISTPTEIRAGWRRERLDYAAYALGWRVFTYRGHKMVFHAGAVRGYGGLVAFLPDQDIGIVVLWNNDYSAPSAFLPTWMDRALGIPSKDWLGLNENSDGKVESD